MKKYIILLFFFNLILYIILSCSNEININKNYYTNYIITTNIIFDNNYSSNNVFVIITNKFLENNIIKITNINNTNYIFIAENSIFSINIVTNESYSNNIIVTSNNNIIYIYTNIIISTQNILIYESFNTTNNITNTINIYTSTNFIEKSIIYEPLPANITVYVDSGSHSTWTDPRLFWWNSISGSGNEGLQKIGETNDGYINWWIFVISNIDIQKPFGVKLKNGPTWNSPEPIKTENGNLYDRIVKIPLYTFTNTIFISFTNIVGNETNISNVSKIIYRTFDKIFVYSPAQWYESFPYFYETETNLYRDPDGGAGVVWNWYMGANYWGNGITAFSFYGPNVRRVWVAGEFNTNKNGEWLLNNMYLTTDRVWWWVILSNTKPNQKYKFVLEKYANQWGGPYIQWVSDPASKKNYGSAIADSIIIDQNEYQWEANWERPYDFIWYSIYQIHIRTFNATGFRTTNWEFTENSYWGWGTFRTAVEKFDYISGIGFTAIEPLPINEFGGDQSWGYNYTLFYAPESAYCGTNYYDVNNFKYFVDEAHKRGLAVIIDLVFNHMGASDDPIGSYDPAIDWNNPQTYWYSGKTDWGPRFNYSNPVVEKFLIDSAKYFAQYYKIDGFRFDATYYIAYNNYANDGGNFLYKLSRALKAFDNRIILIAENLPNWDWITSYDGGRFDFQWNVDLSHKLKKLFYDGTSGFSISELASVINQQSFNSVNYLVSHDEAANGKQRTAADLHYVRGWGNSDYDAQYQQITGIATALFAKGIPMLLQGDEFLEGFYDDDYWGFPYNRRYFHDDRALSWNSDYNEHPYGKPSRWRAMKTMWAVSHLANIRKYDLGGNKWSIWGIHVDDVNKIIGFGRGDNLYIIINYNKSSKNNYYVNGLPWGWRRIFQSPSSTYGDDLGWADEYSDGNIYIPEYGVIIYKKP